MDDVEKQESTDEKRSQVKNIVEMLAADFDRQDGKIKKTQLDRIVLKKNLGTYEILEVIEKLTELGVVFDDDEDEIDNEVEKIIEPNEKRNLSQSEFVPGVFDRSKLSRQQEIELGRKIQIGLLAEREVEQNGNSNELKDLIHAGRSAKQDFLLSNTRLVLWVAHHLKKGKDLDFKDIVQDGMLGLMRAIELFDPDLGLRFSTYATWWIRQSILRGIDNNTGIIRVPVHRLATIRKFVRTRRGLFDELGREPNISELAETLQWDIAKVAYISRLAMFKVVSLDAPLDETGEFTISDTIQSSDPGPDRIFEQREMANVVRQLLNLLPQRSRSVILRRFGIESGKEETLEQIGASFGVTRERIRQIEKKTLQKLKLAAKNRGANHYI